MHQIQRAAFGAKGACSVQAIEWSRGGCPELVEGRYDAGSLRRLLREVGAIPVMSGRRNRKRTIRYDKQRYR